MSQQAVATPNAAKTPAYAWVVLFALYMATLSATLNLFKVPPVLGTLMEKFNFSNSQAGLIMSVFSIMGFVLAIPAGFILKRFGIKTTGLLAVGSLIIGSSLGAMSTTSNLLFFGRFIEGIGMGLIMVASPFAISVWFPMHNRALPTGLWASSVGIGNIVTLLIGPKLAEIHQAHEWQYVWWATAAFSVLSFILFAILFRMPKQEEMPAAPAPAQTTQEEPPSLLKGMANRDLWFIAISFGCYNLVVMALCNWLPTFLPNFRGCSLIDPNLLKNAGFLTALIMLASIFSGPGGGNISDRLGKRKIMIVIPYILMALTFLFPFKVEGSMIPAWMILFGIIGGPLAPVLLASVPEVARKPQYIGIGMSVAAVGQNIGMFIGPPLFGAILDYMGKAAGAHAYVIAGYWMIPICVVGIIATLCIKVR
jgi:MFS family permease